MSQEQESLAALILGGGYSTRLYPLTLNMPKALLGIEDDGEKVILDQIFTQIVESLKRGNISKIALVSNHHYAEQFRAWLETKQLADTVILIDNGSTEPGNRLGAVGDLALAIEQLGTDQDLLIVSSDTLSSLDLDEFIAFHKTHRGVINAVYDTGDVEIIQGKLGNLEINAEGKVVRFLEKPPVAISTVTSVPFYIFSKESLPLVKEYVETHKHIEGALDSPGKILEWLISKTDVYAFELGKTGYYFDVGTLPVLERLRQHPDLIK